MKQLFAIALLCAWSSLGAGSNDLIEQLYSRGMVKQGSFTLRSGVTSSIYIDMRMLFSHIDLLRDIAVRALMLTQSDNYDCVCGVPYGAVPLATAMALAADKPLLFLRKEAKNYGTQQLLEGVWHPGDRVLLIEDVMTTGQSIVETAEKLRALGVEIAAIIVIVDRQAGGAALLEAHGYSIHALLTLHELMAWQP